MLMQPVSGLRYCGGIAIHGRTFGAARGYPHLALSGQNPYQNTGELPLPPTATLIIKLMPSYRLEVGESREL